jgi:hypothetical protein
VTVDVAEDEDIVLRPRDLDLESGNAFEMVNNPGRV